MTTTPAADAAVAQTSPDETAERGLGFALLVGLWFGAVGGLIEVAGLLARRAVEGEMQYISHDTVWMAPVGNAVLFAVVGVLLFAVGGLVRPLRSARVLAFLGTAAALWGALLIFGLVHPLASLAIAAGVGSIVARPAAANPRGFTRFLAISGLLVVLAVGALGASTWFERSSRQGDATPAAASGPNVLLLVLDTVRAQSLSLYGHERQTTPKLDALATSSVVFERAVSTAPWTLPSHASMFTGTFPHEQSTGWALPMDDRHQTLAETLAANGYATAGFASNLNYCARESGIDRGFQHYEDYPVSVGQVVLSMSYGRELSNLPAVRSLIGNHDNLNRKTADDVQSAFLDWLDGHEDRPFFAFLNYYDAHQPYLPPAPFDRFADTDVTRGEFRYDTNLVEIGDWTALDQPQIDLEQDLYEGAIAYLDDRIGQLLEELKLRGQLDNTLVIVTSDHGEQFGAHGLFDHGNSLYGQCIFVPLLLRLPVAQRAAHRVTDPVSLRNLPATVLEVVGLTADPAFPGQSMVPLWTGEERADRKPEVLLSEVQAIEGKRRGDMKSLVVGPYHYILNGDGKSEELYVLENDPLERHDRTNYPDGRDALPTFRDALKAVLPGNE
ncbi:MAG: sulfatase-like hydrolase/transferase [Planctomycetota bacterium]